MDNEQLKQAVRRQRLEEELKQDYLGLVSERVSRYMELNFIPVVPNVEPFVPVSAECIILYRDGYFYACIALCQAVAEALVRFICERSQFGASISKDFESNVKLMQKRNIKPDCSNLLMQIWKDRHDYHHLNISIETERDKLQNLAKSKIMALHNVESEVFAFDTINGAVAPKYPKYWDIHNGRANVFLRFEP